MSRVVALSGGIGGAKLALGLSHLVEDLVIIANTGDDFDHFSLAISPDIDTLTYTLAGLDNAVLGWGRADESWNFMEVIGQLGGPTWFRLGDRDLALHAERTRQLTAGETITAVTAEFARRLGIRPRIVPMSNDPVRTRLETEEGWLDFQDYFVRLQCRPVVKTLAFAGAETARANPDLLAALAEPGLRAVIICPSNPFISVEPILALRGVRAALQACAAPVIAVSPIIGGKAVKGPTAKMMAELGLAVSAVTVAERYADFLTGYVLDTEDANAAVAMPSIATRTLMTTREEKIALARDTLAFADRLASP